MNKPLESPGSIECFDGGSLRISHEVCGAVIMEASQISTVMRGRMSSLSARRIAQSLIHHAEMLETENDALSDSGADVAAGKCTSNEAIASVANAQRIF
jgi:hypothetical protein